MHEKRSFRLQLTGVLVLASCALQLRGQTPHPPDHRPILALQAKGMTAADRDALTMELGRTGKGSVVFACVPAGIILIEPAMNASLGALRECALPILQRHASRRDIKEADMTMIQAEQRCAEARLR